LTGYVSVQSGDFFQILVAEVVLDVGVCVRIGDCGNRLTDAGISEIVVKFVLLYVLEVEIVKKTFNAIES